jgi:hypothetical protein
MEHLSNVMLYKSHLRDLDREAQQTQIQAQLPRRSMPWPTVLIAAVVLIGMLAWLIH